MGLNRTFRGGTDKDGYFPLYVTIIVAHIRGILSMTHYLSKDCQKCKNK
jgi:hypothetical protein